MRAAGADDAEFVWQCRNEPATRAVSRMVDPIPLDEHVAWFNRRLEGGTTFLLIVETEAGRAGYVRLDRGENETEISIALAPVEQGRGIGTAAIRAATEGETAERSAPIAAYVKEDNPASLAAFRRAGYVPESVSDGLHRLLFRNSA